MELKKYQERVMAETSAFLRALAAEHAKGNHKYGSLEAWGLSKARRDSANSMGTYALRHNGMGRDLPTICIKVPTGGGKTLLATQALGEIYSTILRDRGGAGGGTGLVVWVVPSSQIYNDTIRRLRDRNDLYRLMLEHAASRRVEVWEKHEVARLSPARLRDGLNILVIQLASTNRETKDQLKFFQDSGGNIVQHFPPEHDFAAHKALKDLVPNLDMIEEDAKSGRYLVKTSIANLVRICQPPVILDEGHKATSDLARKTLESFNASIVVELSATPKPGTNILCRVSGQELLREEMIKLPLNVKTSRAKRWQDVLTEARDKRIALAQAADKHARQARKSEGFSDKPVRPIVLVQVQRTGDDQRDKKLVHSEDVREYLRQQLDVPDQAIAIKTSGKDGLENVDLLDEGCPIEWIITKSALQEGWDCPFAYILVSLDNTGSPVAMTQLVGRILRQPFQKRFPDQFAALNESYVYCWHDKPAEVVKAVKSALEKEGYEGDLQGIVRTGDAQTALISAPAVWRPQFAPMYTEPFEGKIYLPQFCVKEGKNVEPLDYFRHLFSGVKVDKFEYGKVSAWSLADVVRDQKSKMYRVTLGSDNILVNETETDFVESDESVLGWLAANLDFQHLSQKDLRTIVHRTYESLLQHHVFLKGRLSSAKIELRNRLAAFVQDQIDAATEKVFGDIFDEGRILFHLHCEECRFEMPQSVKVERIANGVNNELIHDDGEKLASSLFDFVERQPLTTLEKQVALVLDRDEDVLWWYRNKVGRDQFAIQGYRRHRIHPDFLVQGSVDKQRDHRVLVIESKGDHLKGSDDTMYKRSVADYFEKVGKRVTWQQLGEPFKDHRFRFQVIDEKGPDGAKWSDELQELLAS
jgi:type III restriction enzyme